MVTTTCFLEVLSNQWWQKSQKWVTLESQSKKSSRNKVLLIICEAALQFMCSEAFLAICIKF